MSQDNFEKPEDHLTKNKSATEISSIESTKADIVSLIKLISSKKKACDELSNETQYMKDYVASFISTGDLRR